ncbi:hypothetical protein [Pseudomonas putida]
MTKVQLKSDGVQQCKLAFQRLMEGLPIVPCHKDILPEKITPGIVSVEAGFDRGYLKKSRAAHQELIAQINTYRAFPSRSRSKGNEAKAQNKRYKSMLGDLEVELRRMGEQRDTLLAQNVLLYEKVKELENLLKQIKNNR